ncbi:MAG: ribosome biogenesis GTP-binding protein YihA/YsxC [Syntrophobacteraceae bacterium]
MSLPIVIQSAEFVTSAVRPAQYPSLGLPEIAFAGRSNVGKSSLINCLVQRRKLVRTSRTPGQTQLINFFNVNEEFLLVDLPGYGFARVPDKVRAQWGPMVESYLGNRLPLLGVVQIMDLRHPPTADDLQLWQWLKGRNIPALPVLTKADKVTQSKRIQHAKQASVSLGIPVDQFILFSAETRLGREQLLGSLYQWINPAQPPLPASVE